MSALNNFDPSIYHFDPLDGEDQRPLVVPTQETFQDAVERILERPWHERFKKEFYISGSAMFAGGVSGAIAVVSLPAAVATCATIVVAEVVFYRFYLRHR